MITLFSGLPGSGKSYKMVAEAFKNKDKKYIIHNIVGFKTEILGDYGFNWSEYIEKNNLTIETFFSKEYQNELSEQIQKKYKRSMLIIIDEAHEWFGHYCNALKMWLSYHRHLDQEIYLVAHSSRNIPQMYRSFIECEYRAKSSTILFLPMFFFYNRIVAGQRIGYILERKRKEIFDLYKSQDVNEENIKPKRSIIIPLLLILSVVGVYGFLKSPEHIIKKNKKDVKNKVVASDVKNVNPAEQNKIMGKFNQNEFESKYAYVGEFNGQVVVEDRKSGEQYPLTYLNKKYRVLLCDRQRVAVVESEMGDMIELHNYARFKSMKKQDRIMMASSEGGARQQSAEPEEIGQEKNMLTNDN